MKRHIVVLPAVALGVLICIVLGGCESPPSPTAVPTPIPATAEPTPPASPTPTPRPPRILTICLGAQPAALYVHDAMYTEQVILEAIYDGPIDSQGYSYQPVILEKLPSLADGDAVIDTVTVGAGDLVLSADDVPITLSEDITVPLRLRPAGCREDACAVEWLPGDGPIDMERMVVTFTLKPGITWADGEPVTAADSAFSYRLYADPDSPVRDTGLRDRTASYEALDESTTVWTGLPGYRDSAYMTRFWTPLPEHLLGQMPVGELIDPDRAGEVLLGYGPFTFLEWVPDNHVTVERNPYYFRAAEELPYFDQVVFRFYGQDAAAAIEALLEGECDVLTQDVMLEGQAERLMELEAAGQVRFYAGDAGSWEHLDFGIEPAPDYERADFFEDVRMRQAIALCLDRQAVVDRLLYGRSSVPQSYVPPDHPLYEERVRPYAYDPIQAMVLLEEMGWRDTDADGVREARGVDGIPDGTRLSFVWQSTTAPLRVAYMEAFQANLQECGIEVTLENLPAEDFFADGPEGLVFGRRFDLVSFAWRAEVEPFCRPYLCSEIPAEWDFWGGYNHVGYCSTAFDDACGAALQALPGMPEYERFHRGAQIFFSQDLPALPLFQRLRYAASRPDLQGLVLEATESVETWNIEQFALQP